MKNFGENIYEPKKNEAYQELVNVKAPFSNYYARSCEKNTKPSWIVSEKEDKLQLLQR